MKATTALVVILLFLTFGAITYTGNGITASVGGIFGDMRAAASIRQQAETERARIAAQRDEALAESRERTLGTLAPWVAVTVGTVALCWFGVHWSRRPHRPAPPQVVMLAAPELRTRPGARLEVVDGEWCVVDDARRELVPVERRLLG